MKRQTDRNRTKNNFREQVDNNWILVCFCYRKFCVRLSFSFVVSLNVGCVEKSVFETLLSCFDHINSIFPIICCITFGRLVLAMIAIRLYNSYIYRAIIGSNDNKQVKGCRMDIKWIICSFNMEEYNLIVRLCLPNVCFPNFALNINGKIELNIRNHIVGVWNINRLIVRMKLSDEMKFP